MVGFKPKFRKLSLEIGLPLQTRTFTEKHFSLAPIFAAIPYLDVHTFTNMQISTVHISTLKPSPTLMITMEHV